MKPNDYSNYSLDPATPIPPSRPMDPNRVYAGVARIIENVKRAREVDSHGNCSKCGGTHYGSSMYPINEELSMPDANKPETVSSTSDGRTVNNVMRHEYRVLSDVEKAAMQKLKDLGLELHKHIESLGASREVSLAKTKVEEAVMWASKHLTR